MVSYDSEQTCYDIILVLILIVVEDGLVPSGKVARVNNVFGES